MCSVHLLASAINQNEFSTIDVIELSNIDVFEYTSKLQHCSSLDTCRLRNVPELQLLSQGAKFCSVA